MWSLDGIRVFTQDLKEDVAQIIPRLQPLSGGTVLQIFGYESDIYSLSGIVVGKTDKNALKNLTQGGGTVNLIGPEGSEGNFEVKSVSAHRVRSVCQTLRPDLPDDSPVFEVDIQLYA